MDDTLEYWKECLVQFEQALISEREMEEPNDTQIKLLKAEIQHCNEQIESFL